MLMILICIPIQLANWVDSHVPVGDMWMPVCGDRTYASRRLDIHAILVPGPGLVSHLTVTASRHLLALLK